MRLKSARIENFRAIRNAVALTDLGDFEVLHGDNNAGKSSILLAIALGLHLMGRDEVWQQDDDLGMADGESVDLPSGYRRLSPHRDRPNDPIRIALEFSAAPVARLEAELRRAPRASPARWLVKARWWPTDHSPVLGTADRSPAVVPNYAVVDSTRQGAAWTWDAAVVLPKRDRTNAEARKRFKALGEALRRFAPELGPGELTDVGDGEDVELAWEDTETGQIKVFSDEGSGLRAIKDILAAAMGSDASVILIEEPEVHLTSFSQARLRDALESCARGGRQFLVTSHVFGFDGRGVWRISRDAAGDVQAVRDAGLEPSAITPLGESEAVGRWEAGLAALYGQTGRPHAGFISRDGLTILPSEIRNELRLPTDMAWARMKPGVYAVATLDALRKAEEEQGEP